MINIPYAAEQAGCAAVKADSLSVSGYRFRAGLASAAPLILAAELRDLLRAMEKMRLEMRAEDSIPSRSSGLSEGIALLRHRIAELDPEGLTS